MAIHRCGSINPDKQSPYRTQAEMPEEPIEEMPMSDTVRITKMLLIAATLITASITGGVVFSGIHTDQTTIAKAQIESGWFCYVGNIRTYLYGWI